MTDFAKASMGIESTEDGAVVLELNDIAGDTVVVRVDPDTALEMATLICQAAARAMLYAPKRKAKRKASSK